MIFLINKTIRFVFTKSISYGLLTSFIPSNIIRVTESRILKRAGNVARMEEDRSAFKLLTGKAAEKKPLGRPRRRWEDNISGS